jgi:hypothetical protein
MRQLKNRPRNAEIAMRLWRRGSAKEMKMFVTRIARIQ